MIKNFFASSSYNIKNDSSTDNSVATTSMPKTGSKLTIVGIIFLCCILSIIFIVKTKEYNDVK